MNIFKQEEMIIKPKAMNTIKQEEMLESKSMPVRTESLIVNSVKALATTFSCEEDTLETIASTFSMSSTDDAMKLADKDVALAILDALETYKYNKCFLPNLECLKNLGVITKKFTTSQIY